MANFQFPNYGPGPRPIVLPNQNANRRNPFQEQFANMIMASARTSIQQTIEQKFRKKALEEQRQYDELQAAKQGLESGKLKRPEPYGVQGIEAPPTTETEALEQFHGTEGEVSGGPVGPTVDYAGEEYEVVSPEDRVKVIDVPGLKGHKVLMYGDKMTALKMGKSGKIAQSVTVKPGSKYHETMGMLPGVYKQEVDDEGNTSFTLDKKFDYDLFEKRGKDNEITDSKYVMKGENVPSGYTKAKGVNVTQKGGDVTLDMSPKTKSKLEEGVMNPATSIAQYKDMLASFDKDYFTYWGKGAAVGQDVLSKLGIGKAEFASKQRAFMQDVKQGFNKYRKEITGAQASFQEIQYLKETIPSDEDSPAVWESKAKRFIIGLARLQKRNSTMLEKGLPLPSNKDQYAETSIWDVDLNDEEITALGLDPEDAIVKEAFAGRRQATQGSGGGAPAAAPTSAVRKPIPQTPVTNYDSYMKKKYPGGGY